LPWAISFEEFAAFYKLPATDIAKLEILEVCLGDRAVEQLKREDWNGEAKFSALSWAQFLKVHKQLISDI
ncbi:hypothetical protein L208DRAFT_1080153, partial [Tricholoma matsutake]